MSVPNESVRFTSFNSTGLSSIGHLRSTRWLTEQGRSLAETVYVEHGSVMAPAISAEQFAHRASMRKQMRGICPISTKIDSRRFVEYEVRQTLYTVARAGSSHAGQEHSLSQIANWRLGVVATAGTCQAGRRG